MAVNEEMCSAEAPEWLVPGGDLCWHREGHEGFHKCCAQMGPGWRMWAEWDDRWFVTPADPVVGNYTQTDQNFLRDFLEAKKAEKKRKERGTDDVEFGEYFGEAL